MFSCFDIKQMWPGLSLPKGARSDNKLPRDLGPLPLWLTFAPWVVMVGAWMLAFGVLLYEVNNVQQQNAHAEFLLVEKSRTVVASFESALESGIGLHWTEKQLHLYMRRATKAMEVHALALVNGNGLTLRAYPTDLTGKHLLSPAGKKEDWETVHTEEGTVFRFYKEMRIPALGQSMQNDGYSDALLRSLSINGPLRMVVDHDLSAQDAALVAGRRHVTITALLMLFVTILGILGCCFLRAFDNFRRRARESSALTAQILRTLPVGVLAVDKMGRITTLNDEVLRIAELRNEEARGRNLATTLPSLWHALHTSQDDNQPVLDKEIRCDLGQGRSVPLALSTAPLHSEDGNYVGSVLIMRDLGELRHLQAEVRRRDRLAALGTLATGIAHEVRNPLSAIKGFARYFQECHPEGSKDGTIAATLGQEVLRLDKVVGDLLDFARPDSVQRELVSLDDLVERSRRMAAPALEAQGVNFVPVLPQPPLLLWVDGDGMAQVLINLFLNAVDAMRHTATQNRRLKVTASVEQNKDLVLEVRDWGTGIAEENIHSIFSPYFTTKVKGTGLGLSIVHKIVVAHQGSIAVRNCRQRGCVFTLHLPQAVHGEQT